ncbi:MAG: hypothetical protein ABUS51_09260 [Acidobacteriota bacterium]
MTFKGRISHIATCVAFTAFTAASIQAGSISVNDGGPDHPPMTFHTNDAGPDSPELFGWSFTLLPPDISGPPGSTIGWGYQIVNLDPDFWLSTTALDADLFQFATPLSLFDFPILAPGATVTEFFDQAAPAGLYQQTWDNDAPLGFVNTGTFIVTGDFYIGDPLAGGVLLEEGTQRSAAYSATVAANTPEPRTLLLAGFVLALGTGIIRRRTPRVQ